MKFFFVFPTCFDAALVDYEARIYRNQRKSPENKGNWIVFSNITLVQKKEYGDSDRVRKYEF